MKVAGENVCMQYVCVYVCVYVLVCIYVYIQVVIYVCMNVYICVIYPHTTFTFLTSVKTQLSLSYPKLSSLSSLFSHLTFRKLSVSLPNPLFSDFTPNGFNVQISGFRRDVVEVFALLRCYAAQVGSCLRMIGDNFAVQFSNVIFVSKFFRQPF